MAKFDLTVLLLAKDMASKTIGKVGKEVSTLGRISGHAVRGVQNLGANLVKLGAVASVGIGLAVRSGISSLVELENATTAVAGAITQMGLAGSVTATQVATWANEIESDVAAAFDDKAITAATATLIRYGKVAPTNLREAMVVMTDLAAKTGSVESASELLAKALADPTKAAGKLARQGVILTKSQQDTIKAMVAAGDAAGAQAYLLRELAKTTQGAALATQGPYARAMSTLQDVTEDAQRALAEGFLPVLMRISDWLKKKLADPRVIEDIRSLGRSLAGAFDKVLDIVERIPWDSVRSSMELAGKGAKFILDAFTSLPPWVQTAVLTGWGLNKLSGGAIGSIFGELVKGTVKAMAVKAGVVHVSGPIAGGRGGLPLGGGAPAAGPAAAGAAGIGAAGLGTLAAGIGGVLAMYLIPYLTKGPQGSSGPTLETNRNPAFATTAVLNSLAQQMTATARETAGVREKVSTVSADIRNGFAVQATALRNGFTTVTSGGSKTVAEIRNGFNVNAQKTAALASTIRSGDDGTNSRLSSLNAAVNRTTSTLAAKNFSPRVTVPVTVTTNVSVRAVTQKQRTVARYTGGTSTGYTIR